MTRFCFNNIEREICQLIRSASMSIKVAVTWFTNDALFRELLEKIEQQNLTIDLIVLNDRINNKREGLDFQNFVDKGGRFFYSSVDNMVHHKFCIIDNKIVITGSYNWTYYAEHRNWENIAILDDSELVSGYCEEFSQLINQHPKIEKISESQSKDVSIYGTGFLKEDYIYQAEHEIKRGNELRAAQIYTEVLKIDQKQPMISEARKSIVDKYNQTEFEISPFEIGILYKNGYSIAIPAFVTLPFTIKKGGQTVEDNQKSVQITIQKFDVIGNTIMTLNLNNMMGSPCGTEKIEHILSLEKSGSLSVRCNEIGGNGKTVFKSLNIRNYL